MSESSQSTPVVVPSGAPSFLFMLEQATTGKSFVEKRGIIQRVLRTLGIETMPKATRDAVVWEMPFGSDLVLDSDGLSIAGNAIGAKDSGTGASDGTRTNLPTITMREGEFEPAFVWHYNRCDNKEEIPAALLHACKVFRVPVPAGFEEMVEAHERRRLQHAA